MRPLVLTAQLATSAAHYIGPLPMTKGPRTVDSIHRYRRPYSAAPRQLRFRARTDVIRAWQKPRRGGLS